MPSETKTKTILLADLVGSTAKVTGMETEQAADFLHDATKPIEDMVLEHNGTVIKFTGDGYFATFDSADDALEAADEIRNYYLRQKYTPTGVLMDGVRLVINTADIVLDDGDIIGDGVIVAARLEKNVPTNHIWVTAATREVASNTDFGFEPVGEIIIRGRPRPVFAYELQENRANYMEENLTLLITDLHHYIEISEKLPPAELNEWLMRWGDLHREAVKGLRGRVRQFVADMALLTFESTDDAFHALLNLRALVKIHNAEAHHTPYEFKGAMATGDLILSPTGIVGALVNRTFDVLNATPRSRFCTNIYTFQQLSAYQDHFEVFADSDHELYIVKQA